MTAHLENLIEHFCQWVWNSFTDVKNTDEMKRVLDYLELANQAADDGNRGAALGNILYAIERVFGCNSQEYLDFMHLYFPQNLAWREHIEENDVRWDAPMTQAEAQATMEKIDRRTSELMAMSVGSYGR